MGAPEGRKGPGTRVWEQGREHKMHDLLREKLPPSGRRVGNMFGDPVRPTPCGLGEPSKSEEIRNQGRDKGDLEVGTGTGDQLIDGTWSSQSPRREGRGSTSCRKRLLICASFG